LTVTLNIHFTIAQTVTIQIDAKQDILKISPYIYGRNNSLSDNPSSPLTPAKWQFYKDAGVTMFREGGGNNSTKYNWRKKLSSHPDWYNNVYSHDWDYAVKSLQQNMPKAQGLWSFQLLGKVAGNKNNNFNDWAYNTSQWWSGCGQNLAGGGKVNSTGGNKALTEGNPNLYLTDWTADSTVGILTKWFGENGLKLNKQQVKYWNMDNEVEIWSGTHDDVMPKQLPAEDFMQVYFEVAKKARAIYPEIKLVGPVTANEWQWYNWDAGKITAADGKSYTWLEFFIKRVGEEQKASGIRLLDVLDIHFYPGETKASDIVQLHRVFFDKTYNYPGANGVKRLGSSGWDGNITKEYIFERCREWLVKYVGPDHGVTFSVSEMDTKVVNPTVTAVWYASTLGEFANRGVEFFTPWSWETGMWEVLHLYSRYAQEMKVKSTSTEELYVSAYSSVNQSRDSMTVILINRSVDVTKNVTVKFANFTAANGNYPVLSLSNLPATETFKSHTINAIKSSKATVSDSSFNLSLAPLSITAVILSKTGSPVSINEVRDRKCAELLVYPNPANQEVKLSYALMVVAPVRIEITDLAGRILETIDKGVELQGANHTTISCEKLTSGVYFIRLSVGDEITSKKLVITQ